MRVLHLVADTADTGAAARALGRSKPAVRLEACASLEDAVSTARSTPPDAVLVDLGTACAAAIAALRHVQPSVAVIALLPEADERTVGEALVAGADEVLAKEGEWATALPHVLSRTLTGNRPAAAARNALRVIVSPDACEIAGDVLSPPDYTQADAGWWADPSGHVPAETPDAVVLTDTAGAAALAVTLRKLREGGVAAPAVVIARQPSEETAALYERLGAACVAGAADLRGLPDLVRLSVETSRRGAQLATVRAREQRLRDLVESLPSGVVLVAPHGAVLAVNAAGLETMGARRLDEIVGRPLFTVCDVRLVGDLRLFVGRVCRGTPGQARFSGRAIDGAERTFELRAVPLPREHNVPAMLGALSVVSSEDQARGVNGERAASAHAFRNRRASHVSAASPQFHVRHHARTHRMSVAARDDGAEVADRRQAPRAPATALPELAARLIGGPDVRLVDLSRRGVQLETESRLLPGSPVRLRFAAGDHTLVLKGSVVRSSVSAVTEEGLVFRTAVEFGEDISLVAPAFNGEVGAHRANSATRPGGALALVPAERAPAEIAEIEHADHAGAHAAVITLFAGNGERARPLTAANDW